MTIDVVGLCGAHQRVRRGAQHGLAGGLDVEAERTDQVARLAG